MKLQQTRIGAAPSESFANVHQRAVVGVHAINPLEAFPVEVQLMQRAVLDHQSIQVGNQLLDTSMRVKVQQNPIGPVVVIPLVPLGKFTTHEQQFLAGVRPHVGVQQTQIGELCHISPGIWLISDPLPWTTSSCDNGSMKFSVKA